MFVLRISLKYNKLNKSSLLYRHPDEWFQPSHPSFGDESICIHLAGDQACLLVSIFHIRDDPTMSSLQDKVKHIYAYIVAQLYICNLSALQQCTYCTKRVLQIQDLYFYFRCKQPNYGVFGGPNTTVTRLDSIRI